MEKNKIFITYLVFFIMMLSCEKNILKNQNNLPRIDNNKIETAEIRKRNDSVCVPLNENEISEITNIINNSKNTKLLKTVPKYWLIFKMRDKTIVKYKIRDSLIGYNDVYYKTSIDIVSEKLKK